MLQVLIRLESHPLKLTGGRICARMLAREASMIIKYAVTFEFESRAPLTHRGTVKGSSAATCARRAIEEAQRELRPVNWSSLVYAALERSAEDSEGVDESDKDVQEESVSCLLD